MLNNTPTKRIKDSKKVLRDFRLTLNCCHCNSNDNLHYHSIDKDKKIVRLGQVKLGEQLDKILQEMNNTAIICSNCAALLSKNKPISAFIKESLVPIRIKKFIDFCDEKDVITLCKS